MADLPKRIELFLPGGEYVPDAKGFLWQESADKWGLSRPVSSTCSAAEAAGRLRDLADRIEADAKDRQTRQTEGGPIGVFADAARGAGRFLRCEVTLTQEPAEFDETALDQAALKRLKKATKGRPYRTVKAVAGIAWASPEARQACVSEQMEKGRWRRVLEYVKLLADGQCLPHPPVFLHPALAGAGDNLLREIDGTRRQLAYLEAGIEHLEIVVLVPAE